jgi:hypothetical protein
VPSTTGQEQPIPTTSGVTVQTDQPVVAKRRGRDRLSLTKRRKAKDQEAKNPVNSMLFQITLNLPFTKIFI